MSFKDNIHDTGIELSTVECNYGGGVYIEDLGSGEDGAGLSAASTTEAI